MARNFPILPHYPINVDDQACLSAFAALACFYLRLCPLLQCKTFCDRRVLQNWRINKSRL